MPEKKTLERAKLDKREGKAPTTQAGEFVREEMDHVKEGKHPVKNRKQAIAIGLSKARRAGVELAPPKKGKASEATRKKAQTDLKAGKKKATSKRASAHRGPAKKVKAAAKRKSTAASATKRRAAAKKR